MKEKENLGTARLRRFLRAILFAGSGIAAGWSATTQAQSANFTTAPVARSDPKVSVRELHIPAKARNEFNRGLRSLDKRGAAGTMCAFHAAHLLYPEDFHADI